MSGWIVIRTQVKKEWYVAKEIARLGFGDAWVPTEIERCKYTSRKMSAKAFSMSAKALAATRERPVLPKTLFAAVPGHAHGQLMRIRHLVAIEHGPDSTALEIPYSEICVFRDEIDRLNREVLALAAIQTRKHRAKWRDMRSALLELVKGEPAKMEEAA